MPKKIFDFKRQFSFFGDSPRENVAPIDSTQVQKVTRHCIFAFVPESKDRRPRRDSNSEKSFRDPMNENGPSVYLGCRTKGWRQSVFAPFGRDAEKGAPDRRRSGGEEWTRATCCFHRTPGYIHVPLRCDTHPYGTALTRNTLPSPEPTTVKYSRATNYRATHSRVELRRVCRKTIYCRASAETESFMLA